MIKIGIVVMANALEGEKGPDRFRYIAKYLSKYGFQVDLITSKFQHWTKKIRKEEEIKNQDYRVVLCDQPTYYKNIDFQRIYSLYIFANNVKKYLESKIKDYDLIYCSIPDNFTASKVVDICNKNKVPVIIDVEDLWPEAMRMVIDIPIISDILFYPFVKSAEKAYLLCSGVIGTSDEYRDRPFKKLNRSIPKETIYVGNELKRFDKGIEKYSNDIEKSNNEFWITYAGTIGEKL